MGAEKLLAALPMPGINSKPEAGWAREARAKARARMLDAGAPVKRDEYWKYTDPTPLTAPLAEVSESDSADRPRHPFPAVDVARFVNGRFRPDLTTVPEGVAMLSLSEALFQDLGISRTLFGVLEAAGQEKVARPLAALNTACATDGVVIQATGKATLHIEQSHVGEGASFLHHLIRVETGAELTLFESGATSNTVMEIDLAPGAKMHHVRLQTGERIPSATHIFVNVAGEASFKSFTFSADGDLTRNEVVMTMSGDDASGHIAGAVMAQGKSHIDNTVFVTHDAVNCESRQVFKTVLADKSTGVFQGKIFVKQGAQKTDGYQISQAVLLTDGAEFLVKPELEIYADDVACSHGSTTGGLDETALFYLRSRGVPQAEAEAMLVASFVDEAISEIADEATADLMRDEVARWMASR
ncbi:SufD family Fe-S cluster assembly protein [Rhodobacteraceae bacterium NNCM2]|nr:SufD family Fe-S cluster assembly protein [Coraliihabitans acroporae]